MLRKIKEERLTERDLKPTGRQIFEEKSKGLEGFTLEIDDLEEGDEGEEVKDEGEDESDEDGEGVTIYDKNLFA